MKTDLWITTGGAGMEDNFAVSYNLGHPNGRSRVEYWLREFTRRTGKPTKAVLRDSLRYGFDNAPLVASLCNNGRITWGRGGMFRLFSLIGSEKYYFLGALGNPLLVTLEESERIIWNALRTGSILNKEREN